MTYIRSLYLAGALLGSAFAQTATAQTATTSFGVTITIEDACVIVSATDLNFGTVGTLTDNVDAYSNIAVTCTEDAAYDIALDAGLGGGTSSSRVMTNAGNTIGYQLYQDADRTTVWGDTADVLSETGTGSEQSYFVYGRVPPQKTPPAATYTDTVGVTVTF